jgi:hypothetical protein
MLLRIKGTLHVTAYESYLTCYCLSKVPYTLRQHLGASIYHRLPDPFFSGHVVLVNLLFKFAFSLCWYVGTVFSVQNVGAVPYLEVPCTNHGALCESRVIS